MKHQTQKRMAEKLVTAKTEEKAKELEEEAMKVELKTKEEMKPWEQHSAVITIPRFDYNAPLLSSVIPTPDSSSPAPSRGRRVQQKKPCQFLKRQMMNQLGEWGGVHLVLATFYSFDFTEFQTDVDILIHCAFHSFFMNAINIHD
nr:uncharacterized protein LOC113715432 isoform X1 [Coffea arabica]